MTIAIGSEKRASSMYSLLEKVRAGLGAAGVTASAAEGLLSIRTVAAASSFLREFSPILIAGLAILSFIAAYRIVEVPASRELDSEM